MFISLTLFKKFGLHCSAGLSHIELEYLNFQSSQMVWLSNGIWILEYTGPVYKCSTVCHPVFKMSGFRMNRILNEQDFECPHCILFRSYYPELDAGFLNVATESMTFSRPVSLLTSSARALFKAEWVMDSSQSWNKFN